jgi:hypothetical protein
MSGPSTATDPVGIAKLHPLEALSALIQAGVPDLRNDATITRTRVGQQAPSTPQVWPSLSIFIPSGARWVADWSQPTRIDRHTDGDKAGRDKHYEVPGSFTASPGSIGNIVIRVGFWTGAVSLRLGANTDRERARLEQAVMTVFAAERGSLVARVPRCANAWHSWFLGGSAWSDEMAFDKALWSEMDLEAAHPILVELRGVRRIETLQLRFTEDMITPFDSITADQVEAFDVQPDGTITRAA